MWVRLRIDTTRVVVVGRLPRLKCRMRNMIVSIRIVHSIIINLCKCTIHMGVWELGRRQAGARGFTHSFRTSNERKAACGDTPPIQLYSNSTSISIRIGIVRYGNCPLYGSVDGGVAARSAGGGRQGCARGLGGRLAGWLRYYSVYTVCVHTRYPVGGAARSALACCRRSGGVAVD